MFGMAVGAYWSIRPFISKNLAVNACLIDIIGIEMTLSAGLRYMLFVCPRERVHLIKDIMGTMTILTLGSFGISQCHCPPVNRLAILLI